MYICEEKRKIFRTKAYAFPNWKKNARNAHKISNKDQSRRYHKILNTRGKEKILKVSIHSLPHPCLTILGCGELQVNSKNEGEVQKFPIYPLPLHIIDFFLGKKEGKKEKEREGGRDGKRETGEGENKRREEKTERKRKQSYVKNPDT